jgi:ABC-type oligopeptide transport system substrate-binding subunit/class 3 adenylate cyclase
MSDRVSAMVPYIPAGLVDAVLRDPTVPTGPVADRFPSAVLFADVSGFTPLTEALAQSGPEGPEELTRLLNAYFGRMIALVNAQGGSVVKFGGDAIFVLFPARDEPLGFAVRRAKHAADAMQEAMVEFATMQTSIGPVALGMKVGIGAGEVLATQVGGVSGRWEYVIAGDPVRQVAEAEKHAERGEIILSPEAASLIHPETLSPRPLAKPDWSTVSDIGAVEDNLRRFIPRAVQMWLDRGLAEWAAVLRPMTVLFVGVRGLDYVQAEAVQGLHNFMRAAQEIVERYEGAVFRLAVDDKGTVLMALFGAPPTSHEDDPVRAVRCALDMDAVARRQGLSLAVGATTGHVFAGPVGSGTRSEHTVMGDTVNLAARLMSVAGDGGFLCDAGTYSQARDQMVIEPLAPIRVKGKVEPVRVYRPTGETVGDRPVELRARGTLVGRETELARLRAALDTVGAGEGRLLVIEGRAGIGKSRLAAELARMADERGVACLVGAGHSIEHFTPYRAWRDVLISYFDLRVLTDPALRQARVRRVAGALIPEQSADLPVLNDILNLRLPETDRIESLEPVQRQEALMALVLALLRARLEGGPLLLVLENAQWLDSLSWKLAAQVAQELVAVGEPILLTLLSRPLDDQSVAGQQMAELSTMAQAKTLALQPLRPEDVVSIAAACLGLPSDGLPDPVAELVRQRAGGNPFFAEQLVFALQDQGCIHVGETVDEVVECMLVGDLAEAGQALPDTVQGLILARVDRLTPERQLTLKVGAVIGYVFPYLTLSDTIHLHATIDDAELQSHLDALDMRQLTAHYASRPELAYIFRQLVTQDVAYRSMPFAQRRRLHREVAEWYEEYYAIDLSPHYALLAYHWSQAEVAEKAIYYLLLAGDEARALYALDEAIDHYQKALGFLREGGDDEQTARTLMKLGLTYHLAFDYRNARQAYEEGFVLWQKAAEAPVGEALPPAPHPLRVDWPYMPMTLDPALAEDGDTIGVVDQLFSGRVDLGPSMDIVPDVARSWELLDGGLRYVFNLRGDVYWSDGKPVTAMDFEYAWKRVLDPSTESPTASLLYDIKGAQAFHQGKVKDGSGVDVMAPDDLTLVVELEQPTSYFLHLVALQTSYPVPRHVVESLGGAWTESANLVTNGPFCLESWDQENEQDGGLVLIRNSRYHGRFTGNVHRVEVFARPDPADRLNAYAARELDMLSFRNLPGDRDRVRQRYASEYLSVPFLATSYVVFDANRVPFGDSRVRRAFVHAVDREWHADVELRGFAFPATGGFVAPGMPSYSASIGLPYDPDQGRRLLAEAGYPNGDGFPTVEFLIGPDHEPIATYLTAQWRQNLGVDISWRALDWGEYMQRLEMAPPNVFINVWMSDYPDPDNFMRSSNAVRWARWHDETYQQLVKDARRAMDQQQRIEMYRQADQILVDAAAIVPLTYWRSHLLIKPWVKRYPTSATKWWYWKDVIIWKKKGR